MNSYYADLHIHIGRDFHGRPVKITGAKSLTLQNILEFSMGQKGVDIVGIIDCHSPGVIEEIEFLTSTGDLKTHSGGGLVYKDTVTLIAGSELEIYDENCKGPVHVLAYFPTMEKMKHFSDWLSPYVTNIHLSSQRVYIDGRALQGKVKELDGLFIPAHVFTPFKSLFGKGVVSSITEVFDPELIDAIELGLSADTHMADQILELHSYPFLTNSDAHSLQKIAREYQELKLNEPTFQEFVYALKGLQGRGIISNYGLDPLLGKYHETSCADCGSRPGEEKICPNCGSRKLIKGVSKRIKELSSDSSEHPNRPPYIHQVPLEFLPGLGPKTLNKLLARFGTEMATIHESKWEELIEIVPAKIAELIVEARNGTLKVRPGGGGVYGKIE
ncbi:endonuclease Q family protein [Falsibacillus pallidus]|uniref:Uncharacterized protein (TIGR00375 family) n=1 Tax=Falsibacillus pallidus TaxID=493781 RepID=A0A370GH69_9BACI|nr:endonuclease Q family protein [Falsibacillus pallidus]RDI41263.1 uncharacterized protein (TIGR00375 family) [Falsibacillus pallidus]